MAGPGTATTASAPAPRLLPPVDERGELSVAELARGILSKAIRPRAADIRRLAETVLADNGSTLRKAAKKKAGGGKKKNKKDKSSKKLAKIPGHSKN